MRLIDADKLPIVEMIDAGGHVTMGVSSDAIESAETVTLGVVKARKTNGEWLHELEFNWEWKDYSIRACPKRLVRFRQDEKNETIDFMKKTSDGVCFSIAFFKQDNGGYWDLYLVGDRFFRHVPKEDRLTIMDILEQAHAVLNMMRMED